MIIILDTSFGIYFVMKHLNIYRSHVQFSVISLWKCLSCCDVNALVNFSYASLLKMLTIWSKDARLFLPDPALLSTLYLLSFNVFHIHPLHPSSLQFSLSCIPLFFLMDPSDPSLLKMFVPFSFAFKDVACVRTRRGFEKRRCRPASAVCEADQNECERMRPGEATQGNVAKWNISSQVKGGVTCPLNMVWCPKRGRKHSQILPTDTWVSWQYLFIIDLDLVTEGIRASLEHECVGLVFKRQ